MIRAAALGAGLLLSLPAAAANPHPDLTIGVASFPSTLHPEIDPDLIKFYLLGFADRPVTAYRCGGETGLLAVRGSALDRQRRRAAGRSWAWRLRSASSRVCNGATARRWGRRTSPSPPASGAIPNSGFANAHTWSIVSRVDVVDHLTAVMHFTEPNYQFDELGQLLPAHLEEPVFDHASGPAAYMQHSRYSTTPTNPGLYNGPYLITGYDTGTRVVLERNPNWHGKQPAFERIVVKTIGNTAALADQPAQRRRGHGAGRGHRPDARPGAGAAEAAAGPLHLRVQAEH